MYYPFESRNKLYKSIFGAVASGEKLTLRLLLHKEACTHNAYLCVNIDNAGYYEVEMNRASSLDDYDIFECETTFETGLYFYNFRYTSSHGEFFITKFNNGIGYVSKEGEKWQLTCYDKEFKTPDWLKGGIIYQIFPDRFNTSKKNKKLVPNDRFLVDDLSKQPEFKQNNGICSLGNDYYGGDLEGIKLKLPYLASLGVNCIYLNPIFEAHSNHRYNTANYLKIDSLLGNENDLKSLCSKAKDYGISVVLDGVFYHTGDDSVYFNRYKRYNSLGAFESFESKYRDWFKFDNSEVGYKCWWGVPSLPEVDEENPDYNEFITGENGIIRYWTRMGIKGWRLDVADELPDSLLDNIRRALKKEDETALLLGEVWEDASNKSSYNMRRRYLQGSQLDSVMNYPFSDAIIEFVKGGNGYEFIEKIMNVLENYPKEVIDVLMNHLGTHDTARILTILGYDGNPPNTREEQSAFKLNENELINGIRRLRLAALIQYTLPGVPSLYYGDEAGLEGWGDPFCRGFYPWGNENTSLIEFYRWLGKLRTENDVFKFGDFQPIISGLGIISYIRADDNSKILISVNRWCEDEIIDVPKEFANATVIYGESINELKLNVKKYDFSILKI